MIVSYIVVIIMIAVLVISAFMLVKKDKNKKNGSFTNGETYHINFEANDKCVFEAISWTSMKVPKGENFEFLVTPKIEYEDLEYEVFSNGTELTRTANQTYIVYNVMRDILITFAIIE